jgi:hypothetical protein
MIRSLMRSCFFLAEEERSPEDGSPRVGEGGVEGEEQDGEADGVAPPGGDTDHDIEHSIPATLIQDPNADR